VDILILEKYIENHFFCACGFGFISFVVAHPHPYTHPHSCRLPPSEWLHSWPIAAANAAAAVACWMVWDEDEDQPVYS